MTKYATYEGSTQWLLDNGPDGLYTVFFACTLLCSWEVPGTLYFPSALQVLMAGPRLSITPGALGVQ